LALKGEKQANIYHKTDTVQDILHLSEDHIHKCVKQLRHRGTARCFMDMYVTLCHHS